MAEIVKDILSFDLNADKAIKETERYISSLERLEKERDQLQKQGKDVSQINARIAATTQNLNKALSQEAKTVQGLQAQTKVLAQSKKVLSQETQKNVSISARSARATLNLGNAIGVAATASAGFTGNMRQITESVFQASVAFGPLGIAAAAAFQLASPALFSFIDSLGAGSKALQSAQKDTEDLRKKTQEYEKSAVDATIASASLGTQILNESVKAATLFGELANVNTSTERRSELITELNQKYGAYLGDLDLEVATYEDLVNAVNAVTAAQAQRFIKERSEQKSNEILGESVAILAERVEAEKNLTEVRQNLLVAESKLRDAESRNENGRLDLLVKNLRTEVAERKKVEAERIAALNEVNKRFEIQRQALENIKQEQIDLIAEAPELAEFFKETTQQAFNSARLQARAQNSTSKATKKSVKEQKEEYKVLEGSLADLQKQLGEINKQIEEQTGISDEKTLSQLGQQYIQLNKQIEAAKKQIEAFRTEAEAEVATPSGFQIGEIDADAFRSGLRIKELEIELEELAISDVQALTGLEEQRNIALQEAEKLGQDLAQVNKKFDDERAVLVRENALKRAQIELEVAKLTLSTLTEGTKAYREQALAVENLALKVTELSRSGDTVKKTTQDVSRQINTIIGGVQQFSDIAFNAILQSQQNIVSAFSNAVNEQKSTLSDLLNNTETANVRQVQLEQERLDKLEERQKEAQEREANIKRLQIAVNLALTVARAAAEGGGIGSAITIATALAAAIAGFATAKGASAQAFFDGTLFAQRNGAPKGRDTIPAYINEGEAIIPTSTNKKYSKAIRAIYNESIDPSLLGSFVDFMQGKGNLAWLSGLNLPKFNSAAGSSFSDNAEVVRYLRQIASKPTSQTHITEKGLYKVVSSVSNKKEVNSKKYK